MSVVPTLLLQEGIYGTSYINANSRYPLSISPNKTKPNSHWFGAGLPQHPYIHIIKEGRTYFLKFKFLPKLSDHESKIRELVQLWETDIAMLYKLKQFGKTNLHDAVKAQLHEMLESDLYARFFQNSDIHELPMEVAECGKMSSIFFLYSI